MQSRGQVILFWQVSEVMGCNCLITCCPWLSGSNWEMMAYKDNAMATNFARQWGITAYTHTHTLLAQTTPYLRQASPPIILLFIFLRMFLAEGFCLHQHLHHCIHRVFFILHTQYAWGNTQVLPCINHNVAHLELLVTWHWVFEDSVQLAAVVLQSVGRVEVDQLHHRGKLQWLRKTKEAIPMDDSNQTIHTSFPTCTWWRMASSSLAIRPLLWCLSGSTYLRVRVYSPGTLAEFRTM